MPTRNGSLFIFRLFGVNVYIHWSWALAAALRIFGNLDSVGLVSGGKHTVVYHIAWVLALFAIVLLHEFGHALACKSVGGTADTIVLWPLGGVAYVRPPQRPGAMLWSIAAGPLVNVALLPFTFAPWYWAGALHLSAPVADFASDIAVTNLILLIFNMLPIYPLDGGKIVWSLLWFMLGRGMALVAAAGVGILGAAGFLVLAAIYPSGWTAAMAIFMGWQSVQGIKIGLAMRRVEKQPRHSDAKCPACREAPPAAPLWQCVCGAKFDIFATRATCPGCGRRAGSIACPLCGSASPTALWQSAGGFPVVPMPMFTVPPVPVGEAGGPSTEI